MWFVYFILLCIAQVSPFAYYVTPEHEFVYASRYWTLLTPVLAVMLLNLAGAIHRRKALSAKSFYAILVFTLPLAAALFIHAFSPNMLIVVAGITLFGLSMFGIVLMDQIDQYMRQQREIARQRASIMVLQMRPHFIYNTMTSIYYL